jgi:hypothetical protein
MRDSSSLFHSPLWTRGIARLSILAAAVRYDLVHAVDQGVLAYVRLPLVVVPRSGRALPHWYPIVLGLLVLCA